MVGSRTTAKLIRRDAGIGQSWSGAGAWPAQGRLAPIEWREGAAERLSSRFARVRVRAAHRDYQLTDNRPEEWLLIEWPEGEKEPTRSGSHASARHRLPPLVDLTKLRWRIDATIRSSSRRSGRAFRRAGMARLPPPRHAVHRGLRIPDLREGDDSPLSTSSRRVVPAICATQRLPTQGLRPCVPNGTSQTRSQPYAGD